MRIQIYVPQELLHLQFLITEWRNLKCSQTLAVGNPAQLI